MYNDGMRGRLQRAVPWVLGAAGLLALLLATFPMRTHPFSWTGFSLAAGLTALIALSPIPVGSGSATVAHSVSISMALAFGAPESGAGLAVGLLLGEIGGWALDQDPKSRGASLLHRMASWGRSLGQQGVSLSLSIAVYRQLGGTAPLRLEDWPITSPLLGLTLAFLVLFILIQWLKRIGAGEGPASGTERMTFLLLVGFLPLPYAILSGVAGRALGNTALLILAGAPAILAPFVRSLLLAERDLQRRVDELSTLSEVSQAMRTSLNLEAILHTIYLQVAHLLNVRNFYIALHDETEGKLSYPLAIKGGEREQWPPRTVSDRLTDRVILTGEPLLISHDAPKALREMGLPEQHNAPESWLGVPLRTPSRLLGCIGVFHLRSDRSFTADDRDVLVTLAGQASVAIENALLFQQTRRRAKALASLSEITTQMSSSLDPQQTLQLVAHSLSRVVGGDKAAIYLTSEDGERLELVQSTALSEGLRQQHRALPLSNEKLTEAYHLRRPIVHRRVDELAAPANWIERLEENGIGGTIDVPLSTPAGPIGMATVFFSESPNVNPEQLELLETLVAQSALAVANARAHAATDQALERQVEQLSRLESIGREMLSTLDPEKLFEAILDSAMEATGAHIAHLAVAHQGEEGLRLAAARGYPSDAPLPDPEAPHPPSALGLAGTAFQNGRLLNVDDLRKSNEHVDWTGGRSRSLLTAPLQRWGRIIGVITVEGQEEGAFGDERARFLTQVAAYASVAITNAELYQQLEANLREQSLLYQASAQFATSIDIESVAMAFADSLAITLDADGVTVVTDGDGASDFTVLATAQNGKVETHPEVRLTAGRTAEIQTSMETGSPHQYQVDQDGIPSSAMALPLQVGKDSIGAVEILHRQPHHFSEDEIRRAQTITSQAAIALQNTDLFRRIRESHERLVAVLNSTQEAILMVDRDRRVLLANRQFEEFLGFQEEELVGWTLGEAPRDLDEILGLGEPLQGHDRLQSDTPEAGAEDSIIHVDRPQERILQRITRPVLDVEGGRIGWLLILRDITEEKELEETREQLTEMIVHDLRGPLTTIRGSLSLLDKTLSGESRSETTSQALKVSNRSLGQMLGLVNSLLDLARLEGDPMEISREPVDLGQLCRALAELHIPEANEAGLILDVDVPENLPTIQADQEKLRRVLGNLLDNAIKFTPEGGQVALRCSVRKGGLRVSVTDTGPGVPQEMREKIFDRFAQVRGVASRRRGTGLGLAFAKLAVEAHGGRIWVEDNNGEGSAFHLELPMERREIEADD